MKWEDTVIKPDELGQAIFKHPGRVMGQAIAIEQAEVSFKAGMREVVEWARTEIDAGRLESGANCHVIGVDSFQAKLKEWGL